jgi:hypothetical protein
MANKYNIDGRSTQLAATALQAAKNSIRDWYAPSERDLLKHWEVKDQKISFEGWKYFSTYYKGRLNGSIRVKLIS